MNESKSSGDDMPLDLLFTSKALESIAHNLIAALLYDAGKFGVSAASAEALEDIFGQALKDSVKDLKPEKARALRQRFKTPQVQERIFAFQQYGELIPPDFFAGLFEPVVGAVHARLLAKELFDNFRRRLAKNEPLAREVQLLSSDILLLHSQKHDKETRDLLQEILTAVKKQSSIEATIGYQEVPALPKDYVVPATALGNIAAQLGRKNVVLVYGIPGSGKSVIATAMARQATSANRPVFWLRFKPLLTDDQAVRASLLPFLQNETGQQDENLPALLAKSSGLLVFDDLQYVSDDKLQQFLFTLVSWLVESDNQRCTMLFTSREKSDFLPLQKMATVKLEGLSPQEAGILVRDQWQLDLSPAQQQRVLQTLNHHPQYLQFFYEWFQLEQPNEEQLNRYLEHAPGEDESLQDYLMRELYEAQGGADSDTNKLLLAIAFYRIPETREFIERLFTGLAGKKFADTLYAMQNRKGLVQYLSENQRYTLHDVLRDFYYRRADGKSQLHACCAGWYEQRNANAPDLINPIEGAHHYRKAGNHQ